MDYARRVARRNTDQIQVRKPSTMPGSSNITRQLLNEIHGSKDGEPAQAEVPQPTSTSSGLPSKDLKPQWKQPKTVKQFANQASVVCTRLLNGQIDLETARAYSGIARIVAQAISSEVTKSRFLTEKPDLTLDGDVFDLGEES